MTRQPNFIATANACRPCTPMGAALAFKGVEGAVPFLHGSQGCATYMRRYLISHFREPVDIASSALGEKQAIYGGGPNLKKGILNVMRKYGPSIVGVASTCLTETIGDDLARLIAEFRLEFGDLDLPEVVHVSTPSFAGSHADGWTAAVASLVDQLADAPAKKDGIVALFPPLCSPADFRLLRAILEDCDVAGTILPDLSETLDGPALLDCELIPSGGTPLAAIRRLPGAAASLDLGRCLPQRTAGRILEERFGIPCFRLGLPIGLRETDALFQALSEITGRAMPANQALDRGRLVDAYVDGHKYLFGKRVAVYGEEDLVVGLTSLLSETGCRVVLAATGGQAKNFPAAIAEATAGLDIAPPEVLLDADFETIARRARELSPELLVGHSKGYRYAKEWGIPLLRVGFPIHDRFGAQRLLTLGYQGALSFYDRLVNTFLEEKQTNNDIGYGYY